MSAVLLQFPNMEAPPENRLREQRKRHGFSMRRLGEAIGVSSTTIFDLEHGNMEFTLRYMRKIAGVLGISATDLLLESDFAAADERRERLCVLYDTANAVQREQLLRVAEAVAGYDVQPVVQERKAG